MGENGYITVAAANSTQVAKRAADFVCGGQNDEVTVQQALRECAENNQNLLLMNGIYHIDGFYDWGDGGPKAAICIPKAVREIRMEGQNKTITSHGLWKNGAALYVSQEALEAGAGESVDVIRSSWSEKGILNGNCLTLRNMAVVLYDNRHAVRCVDFRRTDSAQAENLMLIAYGGILEDPDFVHGSEHPVPGEGCIGLTMTDGSNYAGNNYIGIITSGFDEGIQVGGEHVVCINCLANFGRYGFTFGNYEANCGLNHPITMINCADELNINLPLFHRCGDKGGTIPGNQEISMISFNMERIEEHTPGRKLGHLMKETVPGTWKGQIHFTVQPAWWHTNITDFQLWENDGSGVGIQTRNSCHKTICTTVERQSYYPTYGQQVFDTDLNKMLICLNPEKRLWADLLGNPVK